ncbi:ABC transporter permease [Embleya hyalina]|uniref:Membrane protein n=1 Tax=Embleya hyalina TaxID=516124 RepID=A0A401YQI2_9ACTN|nr:FtsX-like permease family protein [Embleya hyalina]GCD96805.1 membrane protein [Embleya hyalina]
MILARVSLRGVLAHRTRMLLALVAIVLGTAFVAGTLVFRDSVAASTRAAFADAAADVTITPAAHADRQDGTGIPPTVPARVRDAAARAEGVRGAYGRVHVPDTVVLDGRGAPLRSRGSLVADWPAEAAPRLDRGRAPTGPAEAVVAARNARTHGIGLGDRLRVAAVPGTFEATVVGIARDRADRVGDAEVFLDPATARRGLLGGADAFTSVAIEAAPGVADARLRQAVLAVLPDTAPYTVRTRDGEAAARGDAAGASLDLVTYILLGFAGISVLVGVFLIGNTFSMLVAARTRQSGLLRAVGARRGQVNRLVLGEAGVLGVAGSTLGLALGVALAVGLIRLVGTVGDAPAAGGPTVRPGTPVVVYAVGVLITLAAAWLPARRAGRVPPMAALLRGAGPSDVRSPRARTVLAAVAGVLGGGALLLAVRADELAAAGPLLALGVLLTLLATVAGAPFLSVHAVRGLDRLLARRSGPIGRLARGNTIRDPRRTGATASALMVGIALVSFLSLLAASLVTSVDGQLQRTMNADYFVMSARPMTEQVARAVRETPGLDHVTAQKTVRADLITAHGTDRDHDLTATTERFTDDFRLRFTAGDARSTLAPGGDGITVPQAFAEEYRLAVGDPVAVRFHGGGTARLRVGAIVRDGDVFASGATYVGTHVVRAQLPADQVPLDDVYFATAAAGADRARVAEDLERRLAAHPQTKVRDRESYRAALHDTVALALDLVYALLALAILVAVLGVVNTLALSVVERTRELALLRALGLTRRRIRRMIRAEAVLISVVGALLGLIPGLVWGVATRRVLADKGLDTLTVPWSTCAAVLLGAIAVGVLAAWLPARRATRVPLSEAMAGGS